MIQILSRMDVLFLYSVFRLSFEHNSVRKNLLLGAFFCSDSRLSLRDVDQKFEFGGLIVYGNSYLDSVFRYSKVFRLHAKLHDAAGAIRSHWQRTWLLLYDCLRSKFLLAWSRDGTTLLPLRKNLSTLHF